MSNKLAGTTGNVLSVDLTEGKISQETLDQSAIYKYVGGTCLGVKYLLDTVRPKMLWSDPGNHVYIGSGPLGGTALAGSGSFSIVTKGAMTNGVASTQANGNFGAYLKFSGFDGIRIHGASSGWKYIYIHDGTAELRNAEHLKGKDTWDTEAAIKSELGYDAKQLSVCCIGPAGENLVNFAGVFSDEGHSASHNGVGAVFGSKKLKAIAVSQSQKMVTIYHNDNFNELSKQLIKQFKDALGGMIFNYGTSNAIISTAKAGMLQVRNYTTNLFPEVEQFYTRDRFETFRRPCWKCPSHHAMHTRVTEGPYKGFYGKDPEYEQSAGYGPQIGNTDPGAMVMLANEGDLLGFDANEATWILGWVMECYEKGTLSSDDLDGLEMKWGNVEAARKLMRNIANRRGFGDILANGIKKASEQVGGTSAEMAIFTEKGNTPRGHDHRSKWWEMVDTCVSESATLQNTLLLLDMSHYDLPATFDQHSWEEVSTTVAKTNGTSAFVDSLVLCFFTCSGNLPVLAEVLSAATGLNYTANDCLNIGRRAINMMRVFNINCGLTPDKEAPSKRYGSTPVDGPAEGLTIKPHWNDILKNYYRLMGWDEGTGYPTEMTLKELEIDSTEYIDEGN